MTTYSNGSLTQGERAESGASWFDRLAANLGFSSTVDPRSVIEEALNSDEGEAFSAAERAMLRKTLNFKHLRVESVKVPRAEICAVEESATLGELLAVFADCGHSRVPVYRDTLDEPVGMVHVKDLMGRIVAEGQAAGGPKDIHLGAADLSKTISESGIKRDVIFAPPSMSALDLLVRMQARHIHLALIIDEHGGTDGLVSIEDLLEEVVGNIEDEHDTDDTPLISADGNALIADARAEISDVEARLGKTLAWHADDEVGTLGGLVFSMLGRVPARGEVVQHPAGLEFEVLEADRRRVKKIKLRFTDAGAAESNAGIQAA